MEKKDLVKGVRVIVREEISEYEELGTNWTGVITKVYGNKYFDISTDENPELEVFCRDHEVIKIQNLDEKPFKFKSGDKVRVVKPIDKFEELGTGWSTTILTPYNDGDVWVKTKNGEMGIYIGSWERDCIEIVQDIPVVEHIEPLKPFNVDDIVEVTKPIDDYEELGTGWTAKVIKIDEMGGIRITDTPLEERWVYLASDESHKIKKYYDVPETKEETVNMEQEINLQARIKTENGSDDIISVERFDDGSIMLSIEETQDGVTNVVEVDLPYSAVKDLATLFNACVELGGE